MSSFRGGVEQFCPSSLLCKGKCNEKERLKSSLYRLAVTAANASLSYSLAYHATLRHSERAKMT